MVTIATFNEPSKAKHLKKRLQDAGLKADVHSEGHLRQVAFMSEPQANAKVMVNEEDFEAANKFMVEWEASDPEIGSAIRRARAQPFSERRWPPGCTRGGGPADRAVRRGLGTCD